ncbi:MAG: DUF2207 domain-containing protein [bacterium]
MKSEKRLIVLCQESGFRSQPKISLASSLRLFKILVASDLLFLLVLLFTPGLRLSSHLLLSPGSAGGQEVAPQLLATRSEKIARFQSCLQVHPDGSMTVTEDITVVSAGRDIKRGIFRTFPTSYRDRHGNPVRIGFQLLNVLRDGRPEPYRIENIRSGVKIYIGREHVFLESGTYTYTLIYLTDRQLGYFEDYDELYWNVTGNDWSFTIDQAEAVIELPEGARILDQTAYTGPRGARGKDYRITSTQRGTIAFQTTRPLRPGEGLTIAVAWPKGLVAEPTLRERAGQVLEDNLNRMVALAGLVILLIYYLTTWSKVGRDPAKGVIIPLFSPPRDFSPAAARFVITMGFDQKALAASLVDMAVKGYITIERDVGPYRLTRTDSDEKFLSPDEKRIAEKLFASGEASLDLTGQNYRVIREAVAALREYLEKEFGQAYFTHNSKYLRRGLVLTGLILAGVALSARETMVAAFISIWLAMWTGAVAALLAGSLKAWKSPGKVHALGKTILSLPFLAGEMVGLSFLGYATSPLAAVVVAVIAVLNALFYYLLKAPTFTGRRIMDQIEGFKLYLAVAEKERLNILNPPERTPELFEKYLPYALALDVENAWSRQFADVLAAAGAEGREYSPAWYTGRDLDTLGFTRLASGLGSSMAEAVSASSSPLGIVSGVGGGGASGGGGGGGGGGGW